MHRADKIKTDIYDWPDKYDRDINECARFYSKYASVKYFGDAGFAMDVTPGIMPITNLSYEYDMSKAENIKDPSMRLTYMDSIQYNIAAENYIKLTQGKLHNWISSFTDQGIDNASARAGMGSKTFKSVFDMGSVLQEDSMILIKEGLTDGEKSVIDSMCRLRQGVHDIQKSYMLILIKIMRMVSNIGLAHCYSQLYARPNADKESMTQINRGCVSQAELDMCPKIPLIKLYGSKVHTDAVQAFLYDMVVTTSGFQDVKNLKDIIKVCIDFQGVDTVTEQDERLIVITCYIAIGRILAWKLTSGDISNMEAAAESMFANIYISEKEGGGQNENHNSIYGMLLNVDRVNQYIEEHIIIDNIYNMRTDEHVIPTYILLCGDIKIVIANVLATLKILLSNAVSRCKMCYGNMSEHIGVTATIGSCDNSLISIKCHKKENKHDQHLENAHYKRHKGVAIEADISASNIKTRINAILDKLARGELNEYVTDKNTCYITGQKGGMIMPMIMDTVILRMSGVDTYINDNHEIVIVSEWIKNGIVSRPSKMLASEIKVGGVFHFNERVIDGSKVLRNGGRHMVAGV